MSKPVFKNPLLTASKKASSEDAAREVGREFALNNLAYLDAGDQAPLQRLAEALEEANLSANSDNMAYAVEGFEEALAENKHGGKKTSDIHKVSYSNEGKQFPGVMAKDDEAGNLIYIDDSDTGEYTQGGVIINDSGDIMNQSGTALVASSIHGVTFGSSVAELVRDFYDYQLASDEKAMRSLEEELKKVKHIQLSEECSLILIEPQDWAGLKIYTAQDELPAISFGQPYEIRP